MSMAAGVDLRGLFDAQGLGELVAERDGRLVASPRNTEEVAAALACADRNALAVEIVGAGTKRSWGRPVQADLVVDTRGLAGVREHKWQDLTATMGAGMKWAAMQRELAAHGQMVALDPLWPERATVGGVVAANDSGPTRLRYGSLRDLIIGMTVVLADGTVARSGGKVVKNVAGYDLHKLMTGAWGSLAMITEVTFRLHALPQERRVWSVRAERADTLGVLLMRVLDSRLSVLAMQMRSDGDGHALDVELACLPEVMIAQLEELRRMARDVEEVEAAADVFAARQASADSPDGVLVKVTMLASEIARVSAEVVRFGGTAVAQATGILLARIEEQRAAEAVAAIKAVLQASAVGSVMVLRGPEELRRPMVEGESATLMREIKRRFDPKGTLNSGVVPWGNW